MDHIPFHPAILPESPGNNVEDLLQQIEQYIASGQLYPAENCIYQILNGRQDVTQEQKDTALENLRELALRIERQEKAIRGPVQEIASRLHDTMVLVPESPNVPNDPPLPSEGAVTPTKTSQPPVRKEKYARKPGTLKTREKESGGLGIGIYKSLQVILKKRGWPPSMPFVETFCLRVTKGNTSAELETVFHQMLTHIEDRELKFLVGKNIILILGSRGLLTDEECESWTATLE